MNPKPSLKTHPFLPIFIFILQQMFALVNICCFFTPPAYAANLFFYVGDTPFDLETTNCFDVETATATTVPESDFLSCDIFVHPRGGLYLNNYHGPELHFFNEFALDAPIMPYTQIRLHLIGDNVITPSSDIAIEATVAQFFIQPRAQSLPEEYLDLNATLTVSSTTGANVINHYGDIFFGTSLDFYLDGSIVTPLDRTVTFANFDNIVINSRNNLHGISTGHFQFGGEIPYDTADYFETNVTITTPLVGDAFNFTDYRVEKGEDFDYTTASFRLTPISHTFTRTEDPVNGLVTFKTKDTIRGVAATVSNEIFAGASFTAEESRLISTLSKLQPPYPDCSHFNTTPEVTNREYGNFGLLCDSNYSEFALAYPWLDLIDSRPFISNAYDVAPEYTHLVDLTDPEATVIDPTHTYALDISFKTTRDNHAFAYGNVEIQPTAIINNTAHVYENRIYRSDDGTIETFRYPFITVLVPQDIEPTPLDLAPEPEPEPEPESEPEQKQEPEEIRTETVVIIIPKTPNTGYN